MDYPPLITRFKSKVNDFTFLDLNDYYECHDRLMTYQPCVRFIAKNGNLYKKMVKLFEL
jgi:hypothetical protein